MTRGELLATLEEFTAQFWDDRNWELSLLADKPVESYIKYREEQKSLANADKIDELPDHEKSWLRAT